MAAFNASSVDLTTADPATIICYLQASPNDYNGHLPARLSALFVILLVSSLCTLFPVLAQRLPRLHIPLYIYLFARYFGAGVILATAFIHLLDPAYNEIGPGTCVGLSGHWADYSWCPAIVLASVVGVFLLDFAAERWVEVKYGDALGGGGGETATGSGGGGDLKGGTPPVGRKEGKDLDVEAGKAYTRESERSFKQQIAAFLVLEFGVIFHSVIIGLNLGVVGARFSTLYPVIVFHQAFEGLGIGARMSAIPFRPGSWLPWLLCAAYGLTTPIAISVGLGLHGTYEPGSFTANVVSGVLDSMSAGILLYTGLVELLARDFIFDPARTKDNKRITFMIFCVLFGTGAMALLEKWA